MVISMEIKRNRIALLDEVRGFCVLCMIFYHAFIFMYEQFGIAFGYDAYKFFEPVQPFFSCAFMFICGISCRLSHNNVKRGVKLLFFALALSFITIEILPDLGFVNTEISFGILHFLSLSILIFAALERPLTRLPVPIGAALCLFLFYIFRFWTSDGIIALWDNMVWAYPDAWHETEWLFPIGIKPYGFFSADYFPLIPYLFVFLLGTYVGIYVRAGHVPDFAYPMHSKPLYFLGTNALVVYIVHLPIVFVILSFYEWLVETLL